jgi:hypothetical protein
MLRWWKARRGRRAAYKQGRVVGRELADCVDIYLDRREPELAGNLLVVLRDRLGTIHDRSGPSRAILAQIEMRLFRNQLAAYPDNVLAELRLFRAEVMTQTNTFGVRDLLEDHVLNRAALERDRILAKAMMMTTEASAAALAN